MEDRRLLAVITVDSLLDNTNDDGQITLREAVLAANSDTIADPTEGVQGGSGADSIAFDALLDGGVIGLSLGELAITDALTIDASGLAGGLTVDISMSDPTPNDDLGDGSRIFNIDDANDLANFDATIDGLTLTGGDVSGDGGAVRSRENVTIIGSVITGNHVENDGGGVWVRNEGGTATIIGSMVTNNSSAGKGGGIFTNTDGGGTTTISDSTISGNTTSGLQAHGAGISSLTYYGGTTTMSNNTISQNHTTGPFSYGAGIRSDNGGTTTISNSMISGNTSSAGGGGIFTTNFGGTSTLSETTISGNSATTDGGGIYTSNDGGDTSTIAINSSTITNNSAGDDGGGIWADTDTGMTEINFTTISGNTSEDNGGGFYAFTDSGTTEINTSTITGNSSNNSGGGIFAYNEDGTTKIVSSTISANDADQDGGGILANNIGEATSTITHSIVTGNTSDADSMDGGTGGGILSGSGPVVIQHTIIAENVDNTGVAHDLSGQLSLAFDLIGDNTGSGLTEAPVGSPDVNGNLIGDPTAMGIIDPFLSPLADHGGLTLTHALLVGSPAIDAGDPNAIAGSAGVPEFDQRGAPFSRVVALRIDMGALEAAFDFGDAADPTYPTLLASLGASHGIVPGFHLGASVDAESNGQSTSLADGDDVNDLDDENGVTFLTPLFRGSSADVDVVASADGGLLNAWIDFNANGDWADVGEHVFVDTPLTEGSNVMSFSIPGDAAFGRTFTRFRFSTQGGLSFDGAAPDGEVEDYLIAHNLGDMDCDGDVDFDDIDDFVLGLMDPAAYLANFGVSSDVKGDMDGDGDHDFDDIPGFVAVISSSVLGSGQTTTQRGLAILTDENPTDLAVESIGMTATLAHRPRIGRTVNRELGKDRDDPQAAGREGMANVAVGSRSGSYAKVQKRADSLHEARRTRKPPATELAYHALDAIWSGDLDWLDG